ncbi:uncharacterized protein N7515_006590 [Penicillium bovifimosum]|uniref:Uncharacterized protein n=1 Tax=Penicillium bovifimosum TaxID=126998 RepID=A0A9W9L0X3_9EURO|nr:uncharacterized protein N7515_006590 [Penicillium bovifimosum]KAJ5130551.1 hypothetical protein N7515_006590 [Penicillium bovifimosum]
MCITDDGSGEDWPISLQYLQVGGRPDIQKMPSFRWPQNIRRLDLCGLSLTAEVLENILINEQLHATITRLCIHSSNRVAELWDSAILGELFMLDALEIPVDLFYRLLLHPAFDTSVLPIPIRQLDLLAPCDMEFAMIMGTEIVPEGICGALELTLSLVCSLGISRDCLGIIPKSKHAEIDKLVWKNIDRCPEIELETIFELGVYVINPPAC